MPKEIKLNLDELKVLSFATSKKEGFKIEGGGRTCSVCRDESVHTYCITENPSLCD